MDKAEEFEKMVAGDSMVFEIEGHRFGVYKEGFAIEHLYYLREGGNIRIGGYFWNFDHLMKHAREFIKSI